jgi:hypothetical protein
MSTYEWEHGTITIPAKEWASFRTGLIQAWNEMQQQTLNRAKALHAKGKEAIKDKRGPARRDAMRTFFEECEDRRQFDVLARITVWEKGRRTLSPSAPKKKDFKFLPTSKSCSFSFEDATITLDNAARL